MIYYGTLHFSSMNPLFIYRIITMKKNVEYFLSYSHCAKKFIDAVVLS